MIVERDDPEPAALEDMVKAAFGEAEWVTVFCARSAHFVEAGNVNHVCVDASHVRLEVAMPATVFLGEDGFHSACVDHVVREEWQGAALR